MPNTNEWKVRWDHFNATKINDNDGVNDLNHKVTIVS